MAPHSSTLAWQIPWMEEPGGLQSMGSLGVGHDWASSLSLVTFMHWRRKWQPTPVFLPGESQGRGSRGLPSLGSHRVGHDWSDLAAAAARMGCCHCPSVKWSWMNPIILILESRLKQKHLIDQVNVTWLSPGYQEALKRFLSVSWHKHSEKGTYSNDIIHSGMFLLNRKAHYQ